MIIIRCTRAQQMALVELITEHIRRDGTELFQDTSTRPATSTTPGELLRLVSDGHNIDLPGGMVG
jgi:hypothetical protein